MDLGLFVYALNLASIYALMAIGVSILWSSVGLLNMAHGATFAVSGYGAWLVTGFMKPIIIASFGKTALASFIMASTLVGSALVSGAIFGAIPNDRLGRKKTLVFIGVLYTISAIGSSMASDPWIFALFRFIGVLKCSLFFLLNLVLRFLFSYEEILHQ